MEFKEISYWDGKDKETNLIAEFSLKFVTIDKYRNWFFPLKKGLLSRRLRKQIQKIADEEWGKGKTKVKATSISEGSIEIFFALLAGFVGTAWKFVKDYKDIKEGFYEIKKDFYKFKRKVEAKRYVLETIANRHYYRGRYKRYLIEDKEYQKGEYLEPERKVYKTLNIVTHSILGFTFWLFLISMAGVFYWFISEINKTYGYEFLGPIITVFYFIILFVVSYGFFLVGVSYCYEEGQKTGIFIASILAGISLILFSNICTYFYSIKPENDFNTYLLFITFLNPFLHTCYFNIVIRIIPARVNENETPCQRY